MKPVTRYDLNKVDEYVYEVPKEFRHDMRVPAHFYADDDILEKALEDRRSNNWSTRRPCPASSARRWRCRTSTRATASHWRRGGHPAAERGDLARRRRV